jgi:formylglycine-generating enzyme required for sulfatase activity
VRSDLPVMQTGERIQFAKDFLMGFFARQTGSVSKVDGGWVTRLHIGRSKKTGRSGGRSSAVFPCGDLVVDVFPVSISDFLRFIKSKAYYESRYWADHQNGHHPEGCDRLVRRVLSPVVWEVAPDDRLDHIPVTNVTWFEAYAFSRWKGRMLVNEAVWDHIASRLPGKTVLNRMQKEMEKEDVSVRERLMDILRTMTEDGCFLPLGGIREWCGDRYENHPVLLPEMQNALGVKKRELMCVRGVKPGDVIDTSIISIRQFEKALTAQRWLGFRCCNHLK